jgi:putative flippase GtrA
LADIAERLPPHVRRAANARRTATLAEFMKFGVVGGIGFVFDTAVVYSLRNPLGLIGAGLAAYLVAATITWSLNRSWTFRGRGGGPAHRQWLRFLIANAFGFVLNRGTYVTLILLVPLCTAQPVLAVAAGCFAGMGSNFLLSRAFVFR